MSTVHAEVIKTERRHRVSIVIDDITDSDLEELVDAFGSTCGLAFGKVYEGLLEYADKQGVYA